MISKYSVCLKIHFTGFIIFGVDISKNAVERYAETHFGRKPRNYQEFCSARNAKIIEESKEL